MKDAEKPRPVSFQLDVMPVLTAAGCNTGSCHGSARGQDGFHLSLFGYDPKGDHFRLTTEMAGRRINNAIPEESLLVTKALGTVPHTGGKLIKPDSASYRPSSHGSAMARNTTRKPSPSPPGSKSARRKSS